MGAKLRGRRVLTKMAARAATGVPKLAVLARERQDLVAESQGRDAARLAAITQPPDRRDRKAKAANVARLNEIDARISEIDKQLAKDFREYDAVVNPKPLAITSVQSLLRDNEALVLLIDPPEVKPTPQEAFIWVVTKTAMRWVRSKLGTAALTREVDALRWGSTPRLGMARVQVAAPTSSAYTRQGAAEGDLLPFDLARAHRLYKDLFGGIESALKDKHLLMVPSGALTRLPFQVLVTEEPAKSTLTRDAFLEATWLAKKHAITILPSVSSLQALRSYAKMSRATKPFLGLGNPLLNGKPESLQSKTRADIAREARSCTEPMFYCRMIKEGWTPVGVLGDATEAPGSSLSIIEGVGRMEPVPETACMVCNVARALAVPDEDVLLAARATETSLRQMSASGELAKYRVIEFATHGVLANGSRGWMSLDSFSHLLTRKWARMRATLRHQRSPASNLMRTG